MKNFYCLDPCASWYEWIIETYYLICRGIIRLILLTNDLFGICFGFVNNRESNTVRTWRLTSIFVTLMLFHGAVAYSQDIPDKNEAIDVVATGPQVGDTISSLELTSLHNHSSNRLELPVRGVDLTIVDFWATWCGACIAHFPTMIAIQDSLKDRVQFVSVSKEPTEEVQRFLTTWTTSDRKAFNFPIVSSDTILNSVLPHRVLPHYVWIDGKGVVIAITDSKAVTREKIEEVLSGSTDTIRTKRDLYRAYDKSEPLLYKGSLNDADLLFYSELTGYQEGVGSGWFFSEYYPNNHGDFVRLTVRNSTILNFFQLAYSDLVSNPFKFFKVDVSDEDQLRPRLTGEDVSNWLRDGNGFSYEIILPTIQKERLIPSMRRELTNYFSQYTARVEDIQTEFLVLKSRNKELVRSKGGEQTIENDLEHFLLQNAPLFPLVDRLGFINREKPSIVDETEIDFNVDIDIKADLRNIDDVNQALKPYGLYFELTTRPTPTLVISDRSSK